MTYLQTQLSSSLSPSAGREEIPVPVRAYFEQRLRNRFYQFILDKFLQAEKSGLTKAKLARKIGKTPDVINRWLGSPNNIQIDTACDLILGISGEELHLSVSSPLNQIRSNYSHFDELCASSSSSGVLGMELQVSKQLGTDVNKFKAMANRKARVSEALT
jgi:hypothetical protein